MQTRKRPARRFKTVGVRTERNDHENEDENSLSIEKFSNPDNSDYGYIVEMGLKYPQLLIESHPECPLVPHKEVVQKIG